MVLATKGQVGVELTFPLACGGRPLGCAGGAHGLAAKLGLRDLLGHCLVCTETHEHDPSGRSQERAGAQDRAQMQAELGRISVRGGSRCPRYSERVGQGQGQGGEGGGGLGRRVPRAVDGHDRTRGRVLRITPVPGGQSLTLKFESYPASDGVQRQRAISPHEDIFVPCPPLLSVKTGNQGGIA